MNAQIFTKITDSPLSKDSSNNHSTAWGDYDNDGDMDLYVSNWFPSTLNPSGLNHLYQNNCNTGFSRVIKLPTGIVSDNTNKYQVHWVDYDADGDLDLYFSNALYENKGNGSFFQVNNVLTNLKFYTPSNSGGTHTVGFGSAAWLDYDNDGLLDVYFGRREIYKNNGNKDYTVLHLPSLDSLTTFLRGDAITVADVNNDGKMDVFMCSPRSNFGFNSRNKFLLNHGNGVFSEPMNGLSSFWTASYGCAWGDIDNDLDLDVWICKNSGGDLLMKNDGAGNFTQQASDPVTTTSNVNQAGASFADFDNDGDLDLIVPSFYNNFVYQNDGFGNFTRLTNEVIETDNSAESYSASFCDYDNDGDLDVFIVTAFGAPNDLFYANTVYQNTTSNRNWIKFDLDGVVSNKQAIGARVYVKATINGLAKWQMREVNLNGNGGGGTGAASGHVVHFGLGDATKMDSIKIVWPASGIIQHFTNVPSNQFLKIAENINSLATVNACTPDLPIENPAIIEGRVYKDVNNNCNYEAGIDFPVANKAVIDVKKGYFAYTDNEGIYNLELPVGSFDITLDNDDLFKLSPCLTDTFYALTTALGVNLFEKDFPVIDKSIVPCRGAYDLDINFVGTEQGPCPDGVLLTSPCPGYSNLFCFSLTNNSTLPSDANTVFSIDLPLGFDIRSTTLDPLLFNIAPLGLNVLEITILNPIQIGEQITFCIEVFVKELDSNGDPVSRPYIISANHSNTGTFNNLVFNGDFELGDIGFNSDYNNDCQASPGHYCVGDIDDDLVGFGGNHVGVAFDGNLFMIVDGSTTNGANIWCQDVPVSPNTTYDFSAWFENNVRDNLNFANPDLTVTINGINMGSTGAIANTDGWINFLQNWCSDNNNNARICITNTPPAFQFGGNDFSIDAISLIEQNTGATEIIVDSCSCDPNDKFVTPIGCGPNGNIKNNEELTYKVRFQNEGAGNAHNVLLSDQLDEDLDLSTFQFLSSSHPVTSIQFIPNNTLIVKFDGIELPPLIYDEEGSKGFVVFKIKPKPNLPDGTPIENQTGIYFDRNEVVLTNVTRNTLYENPTPEARFSYKHTCAATSKSYDFTYTGNTVAGALFQWTFEDAATTTSNAQNPTGIVFNAAGYKLVRLSVSRNGCVETVSDSILVETVLNAKTNKVLICHNGKNIEVSLAALQAHLKHGDCVGKCNKENRNTEITTHNLPRKKENDLSSSVFPNPNDGHFYLKTNNITDVEKTFSYALYDINGTVIKKEESKITVLYELNFEVESGIYFLEIRIGGTRFIEKISVQR